MANQPHVSYDGRNFSERLRRVELWRACDAFGISYKPGAPATECRALLEAHSIDDRKLLQWYSQEAGQVVQVQGMNEQGQQGHVELYPQPPLHESARLESDGQMIDYQAAIDEAVEANDAREAAEQKVAASEDVIEKQGDMLKAAMARIEQLESQIMPLERMTPPQLKSVAKERGIDVKGLTKKQDLLDALEG